MRRFRTSKFWLALRHHSQPSHDLDTSQTTTGQDVIEARLRAHLGTSARAPLATKTPEIAVTQPDSYPPPIAPPPQTYIPDSPLPLTGINALLPLEILQQILSHVPFYPLLRCRAVCRLWATCIPGSSPALRAVLFQPRACPSASRASAATLHFRVHITATVHDVVPCEPPLNYDVHIARDELARAGVAVHPVLLGEVREDTITAFKHAWHAATLGPSPPRCEPPLWMTDPGPLAVRPLNAPLPAGAPGWLGMSATWPPVRRVRLRFAYQDDIPHAGYVWYEYHAVEGVVENEKGVGIGQLVSEVYRLVNTDGWLI